MDHAAVDRIHQRLALSRGGTAAVDGELRWAIEIPADLDDDDSPTLSFHNELVVEDGRLTAIQCDARLDLYTPEQGAVVATFQNNLATALRRETATFVTFAELTGFLVAELAATVEEGTVEIPAATEDGEPVFISEVPVAREPWVSLATPFVEDCDPVWLLEQNGLLTHLRFEAFEGDVSLATALPLLGLTGQRVVDMIEDLFSFRERLLEEMDGGGDEAEAENDA
jgi:hypothetical protein